MLNKLVLLSVITFSSAAVAQDSVPDLRGTWVVQAEGMRIDPTDGSVAAVGAESVFVIDSQEGNRISGYEVDQKSTTDASSPAKTDEVIAGVFGPDKIAYMVDENGFRDCWVQSPERMHCVYRHIQSNRTVVALDVWTKQPE